MSVDRGVWPERGLRIALVCDWCLPRFGGLELQLLDLARALCAAGHQPELVTSTPGPAQLESIPVARIAGWRLPYFGVTASPRQFRELGALLSQRQYDVVHIHSGVIAPFAYGAAALASARRIPTALTFHSVYAYLQPALRALAWAGSAKEMRVAWSAVSRLVAAETGRALGGVSVEVLPNGVDPSAWRTASRPPSAAELRIVTAMRLQVRKRPRALLDIERQARLALPGHHVTLDIVGDGPELGAIRRRAARAGGNIQVHGRLTRDELRALYEQSDVFLLPTRLESFGIAALEALCAGLPVVARSGTGVEDFVTHRHNGLFADSDAGLAAALVELASVPSRRAEIAAVNRAAADSFGWGGVVRATLEEYRRAKSLAGTTSERAPTAAASHHASVRPLPEAS